MPKKKEVMDRTFVGVVLPDPDPKHQGRYRVHIPELMPHMSINEGIWCKNHSHPGRTTASNKGIYGSYIPLQEGTQVMVRFHDNDMNTGAIEHITSDYEVQSLPLNSTDRDEMYQILRTPGGSIVQINENTQDLQPNSFSIHHKGYQTTIVMDDAGMHIHTEINHDLDVDKDLDQRVRGKRRSLQVGDDNRTTEGDYKEIIEGDYHQKIEGNVKEKVEGDRDFVIDGNVKEKVEGQNQLNNVSGYSITIGPQGLTINSAGVINIKAVGAINIQSDADVNITSGGTINLSGGAVKSDPAIDTGAAAISLSEIVLPDPEEPEDPLEVIIAERRASNEASKGADQQDPEEVRRLEQELADARSQDEIDRIQTKLDAAKAFTSQIKLFKDAGPTNDGTSSSAGNQPNEYSYFGGDPSVE